MVQKNKPKNSYLKLAQLGGQGWRHPHPLLQRIHNWNHIRKHLCVYLAFPVEHERTTLNQERHEVLQDTGFALAIDWGALISSLPHLPHSSHFHKKKKFSLPKWKKIGGILLAFVPTHPHSFLLGERETNFPDGWYLGMCLVSLF